jgi:hypothetical protein
VSEFKPAIRRPFKIEGVSSVQARVESAMATSTLKAWRERFTEQMSPKAPAHRGTVAERMVELARMAGVRPEQLQTMTVVEFAARCANIRSKTVEVPQ